jgi:hypothetical protein
MDDAKRAYRDVEDKTNKVARELDGHQVSDDIGNAGDDVRRNLGNAGDDAREAADRAGHDMDPDRH